VHFNASGVAHSYKVCRDDGLESTVVISPSLHRESELVVAPMVDVQPGLPPLYHQNSYHEDDEANVEEPDRTATKEAHSWADKGLENVFSPAEVVAMTAGGLALAFGPHFLFAAARLFEFEVNELVLGIPKICAPYLIFIALTFRVEDQHVYPLSMLIRGFTLLVCSLIVLAFAALTTFRESECAATGQLQFSLREIVGAYDSASSKGVLISHAVLLTFGQIQPWVALESIGLLGPAIVFSAMVASAICSRGMYIYTPMGASVGLTILIQSGWLVVAAAANSRFRPSICVLLISATGRIRKKLLRPDSSASFKPMDGAEELNAISREAP